MWWSRVEEYLLYTVSEKKSVHRYDFKNRSSTHLISLPLRSEAEFPSPWLGAGLTDSYKEQNMAEVILCHFQETHTHTKWWPLSWAFLLSNSLRSTDLGEASSDVVWTALWKDPHGGKLKFVFSSFPPTALWVILEADSPASSDGCCLDQQLECSFMRDPESESPS